MRRSVQGRRLPRPYGDQRAAARFDQVLGQRIRELRALRRQREPLGQRAVPRERGDLRGQPPEQREPEALDLGRLHPEPVVRVHPGDGEVRLDRVEPAQLALPGIALRGPVRHGRQRSGKRGEQVRIEREQDAGPGQIEASLVRGPERKLRAVVDLLQRDCAPRGELRAGIRIEQPLAELADQRRRAGLHQEAQPLALPAAQPAGVVDGLLQEVAQGPRLRLVLHHLQPLRIVQAQQLGLFQRTQGAAAGGVFRIALDLRRAALAGGDQEAGGPAVDHARGRVVQRVSRRHLRRLLRVGQDLLVRLLEAAAQGRQGGGGAQELQHAAARGRVVGRGLGPQLARGGWRGDVLVQAAPQPLLLAGDRE